jgi:hypothetical protein
VHVLIHKNIQGQCFEFPSYDPPNGLTLVLERASAHVGDGTLSSSKISGSTINVLSIATHLHCRISFDNVILASRHARDEESGLLPASGESRVC